MTEELDALDIASLSELQKYSDAQLKELFDSCGYYLEECEHHELSNSQIQLIDEMMGAIEEKLKTGSFNFGYQQLNTDDLVKAVFDIASEALDVAGKFQWFVLSKYSETVKKSVVNESNEDKGNMESFMVAEMIDALIANNDELESYALCYEGEIEINNKVSDSIIVEFGAKGSHKSKYFYKRYSKNTTIDYLDVHYVSWIETDSRFKG